MTKGVVYLMTSAVRGLVKIGKTETANFENRMRNLENNGYFNVAGLKRLFAIEVEDYSEKERMLHEIFEKARLDKSELFAINKDLAMELLSAFEGRVVYPESKEKEEIFDEASKAVDHEIKERAKIVTGQRSGIITDNEGRRVTARSLSGKNGVLVKYLLEVAQDPTHASKLKILAGELSPSRLATEDLHPSEDKYAKLFDGVYVKTGHSRTGTVSVLKDITTPLGIQAELEDLGRTSLIENGFHDEDSSF